LFPIQYLTVNLSFKDSFRHKIDALVNGAKIQKIHFPQICFTKIFHSPQILNFEKSKPKANS